VTRHLYATKGHGDVIIIDSRDVKCMIDWQSKSNKPLFKRVG